MVGGRCGCEEWPGSGSMIGVVEWRHEGADSMIRSRETYGRMVWQVKTIVGGWWRERRGLEEASWTHLRCSVEPRRAPLKSTSRALALKSGQGDLSAGVILIRNNTS
jgi:hypothetical protein